MSKLPKLTDEEITALSHEQLADALIARDMPKENVPLKKVDRIAALKAYEPETDGDDTSKGDNQQQGSQTGSQQQDEETDEQKAARLEAEETARAAQEEELRRSRLTPAQRAAEDAAEGKTAGVQDGTGQRAGAKSTAPEQPATTQRPYLDSPHHDFGIHIEGHLVRFKKGRNPIMPTEDLTVEQIVKGIKAESYVRDNGAELVE